MKAGRLKEGGKIVALCTGLACIFGIVHDQITARICLPYFTEFHPDLGLPDNPAVVALAWGVIATWWVGALVGLLIAWASVWGALPALPIKRLLNPLAWLFGAMSVFATLFGLLGYLAGGPLSSLAFPDSQRWSTNEQARLAADLFAHNASYGVGFVGGLIVVFWAYRARRRL